MKTIDDYFKNYSELYQFEEGKPEYLVDREYFKDAMLEYGSELLQLAAERAETKNDYTWDEDGVYNFNVVDRESILILINELK